MSAPIFVVTEDVSPTTQLALTNKNIDGYIRKRDLTRPLLFKLIETAWEKRGYSGSIIECGAAALALCVAFPQRLPLGFPPPHPIWSCSPAFARNRRVWYN